MFFLLLGVFLSPAVFGQVNHTDSGQVKVLADPRIEKMLDRRKDQFLADSSTTGYRIQIYSHTDRKLAMMELENFQLKYPEIPVYVKYDSPNFKLRVGDFSDKIEAQYWFARLQAEYPNLFLVPDKVNPLSVKQ